MVISRDSEGYINGYIASFGAFPVGELTVLSECPNFPEDQAEAWAHFQNNYQAYTFHPVPPSYWEENFGKDYEIPSADIVAQFVYHEDRAEAVLHAKQEALRIRRVSECFTIINRGDAWYALLTEEQRAELQTWYQAWLDVTETLVVPAKPEWII